MAFLKDDEDQGLVKEAGSGSTMAPAAGTGASAQPASAPKYTQSNFTSGKKILEKNMAGGSPNLVGGIQNDIAKQRTELGDKQQAYGQGVQNKQDEYQYNQGNITEAAQGGASFDRIKNLLGGNSNVEKFQYNPNVDIQNINRLQSDVGTMGALREGAQQRGDYGYNRGQASLDAYLFGKSPGGRQQQVGQALADRSALQGEAQAANQAAEQKRATAQAAINERLQALRGDLSGAQDVMVKEAEKARASRNQGLLSNVNKAGQSDKHREEAFEMARQRAQAESGGDPRLQKLLEGKAASAIYGADNLVDIQQNSGAYFSEPRAAEFNRINELLGGNNPYIEASQDPAIQSKLGGNLESTLSKALASGKDEYQAQLDSDRRANERQQGREERANATAGQKTKNKADEILDSDAGNAHFGAKITRRKGEHAEKLTKENAPKAKKSAGKATSSAKKAKKKLHL